VTGRLKNPARALSDLARCAARVTVHEGWERNGAMMITVSVLGEDEALAEVQAVGTPGCAFYVTDATAEDKWGPFAYDVLMERASEVGLGLLPDWQEVSPDARSVWRHYATERKDVDRSRASSDQIIPGTGKLYRALFPEARFVTSKKPTTLAALGRKGCGTYSVGRATLRLEERPLLSGAGTTGRRPVR
jgi:hypothetical protein